MSLLLSCQKISKAYTSELFQDLSLSFFEKDKIGILGPNGAGKSTLLKIMLDLETPDSGEISTKKSLHLAYVPQNSLVTEDVSVIEAVRKASHGNWYPEEEAEQRVFSVLSQVGFTDYDQKASLLSGGWRKRLDLACGLVKDPELLLLDEPTNHLDLDGLLWLENFLQQARFAWILISHDRYFLENTSRKIIEINSVYPEGVLVSDGAYGAYLKRKDEVLHAQNEQKEILANKVRREKEWLSRQPKARSTKAKHRIDKAASLMSELSQVRSRLQTSSAKIDFSSSERKTRNLVQLKHVQKDFPEKKIVTDLSHTLSPGTITGLLGTNGSGKTTILRLIMEELKPDNGSVIHAPNLKLVYFDQKRAQTNPDLPLRKALSPEGDSVNYRGQNVHVAGWAKRFQFEPSQLNTPVKDLSGGEQARLLIARLMLQEADVLLLDEPTNDLDIQTVETLEESLMSFPGAVVLVSHDRYMLNRICSDFIGIDDAKTTHYADYQQWQDSRAEDQDPSEKTSRTSPEKKKRSSLSYLEKQEYGQMEEQILKAEELLESYQNQANDPQIASHAEKLHNAFTKLNETQTEVERLYARWSELEEKAGK